MANVVALTFDAESNSKHPPDVHEMEVDVRVTGAADDTLNGDHEVRFNWRPSEVTFHSHVLPEPLELVANEEDYGVLVEVVEEAAGYLVDEGYEVTVNP